MSGYPLVAGLQSVPLEHHGIAHVSGALNGAGVHGQLAVAIDPKAPALVYMDLGTGVNAQTTGTVHYGIPIDHMWLIVAPLRVTGKNGIGDFNVRVGLGLGNGQHIRRKVIIGVPHCRNEIDVLTLVAVFKPNTVRID